MLPQLQILLKFSTFGSGHNFGPDFRRQNVLASIWSVAWLTTCPLGGKRRGRTWIKKRVSKWAQNKNWPEFDSPWIKGLSRLPSGGIDQQVLAEITVTAIVCRRSQDWEQSSKTRQRARRGRRGWSAARWRSWGRAWRDWGRIGSWKSILLFMGLPRFIIFEHKMQWRGKLKISDSNKTAVKTELN